MVDGADVVAVRHGLPGDLVILIRADSATVRTVRLEPEDGDAGAIRDSVAAQDSVITKVPERLKEGLPVDVRAVDNGEALDGRVDERRQCRI